MAIREGKGNTTALHWYARVKPAYYCLRLEPMTIALYQRCQQRFHLADSGVGRATGSGTVQRQRWGMIWANIYYVTYLYM